MLEEVGKRIVGIFVFIFSAMGSIINPITRGVSAGIVEQIPWWVKLVTLLLIICILMPTVQIIYRGVVFIIKKIFVLFKNNTKKDKEKDNEE